MKSQTTITTYNTILPIKQNQNLLSENKNLFFMKGCDVILLVQRLQKKTMNITEIVLTLKLCYTIY